MLQFRCLKKNNLKVIMALIFLCLFFECLFLPMTVYAEPKSGAADTPEQLAANADARKELPIQSNEVTGWPAGPEIGAEAAILMDVDTGTILYSKNIHEQLYPASTTKLLTCLIAQENGKMSDMVSFSNEAVFSVPRDGSNIGMDVGQSISLEQCMYGILVGSANEVANAVAEHIGGSIDGFVEMMNDRAKELGCTDSHFMNCNGLHDENHYTSAYDLALIAAEYFSNDTLSRIANTGRYHFEPTATQPDDFYLKNKHSLINGEIPYEGIKGGKTGYTSDARQTLVTCCEQNGMRLICVVLMEESPDQFNDTVTLFDYGFSNFQSVRVIDYESRYTIKMDSFFSTGSDIFGNSSPFLQMNEDSRIILPNTLSFDNLSTDISYEVDDSVAQIYYSYNGVPLGSALIETMNNEQPYYDFEHVNPDDESEGNSNALKIIIEREDDIIFINVKTAIFLIIIVAFGIIVLITIIKITKDYHFSGKIKEKRGGRRRTRRGRRKYHGEYSDYDF